MSKTSQRQASYYLLGYKEGLKGYTPGYKKSPWIYYKTYKRGWNKGHKEWLAKQTESLTWIEKLCRWF